MPSPAIAFPKPWLYLFNPTNPHPVNRSMMKTKTFALRCALFAALPAFSLVGAQAQIESEVIPLWTGEAPGAENPAGPSPIITVYRPESPNGTAIVICPGGGYGGLVKGPEGTGIARWLNGHGITGVVLEYRLPNGNPIRPLSDVQQAIRLVRANAKDWNCDPKRIGVMGFSAGGHLASTAATHFDTGDATATDPLTKLSSRPDFAILVYPVITMGAHTHGGSKRNLLGKAPSPEQIKRFSNELQVTAQTPPTFLAHAADDKPVPPENSALFYQALQKHKVPAKFLKLPYGGHGLNGYKGPMWDAWQVQSLRWLTSLNLLDTAAGK